MAGTVLCPKCTGSTCSSYHLRTEHQIITPEFYEIVEELKKREVRGGTGKVIRKPTLRKMGTYIRDYFDIIRKHIDVNS